MRMLVLDSLHLDAPAHAGRALSSRSGLPTLALLNMSDLMESRGGSTPPPS